jgi:hypothetical protein
VYVIGSRAGAQPKWQLPKKIRRGQWLRYGLPRDWFWPASRSSATAHCATTDFGTQWSPPVDASLTIEFEHDSSFFLKAALTVSQMQDLAAVAARLAQVPQWKSQYRVVSATYNGRQCAILSSKAANSKIALSGKADALRQLDLASASAGIDVSSSEQMGLNLVGKRAL